MSKFWWPFKESFLLITLLVWLISPLEAYSASEPNDEPLPIQASSYSIKVLSRSNSNRTYLLESSNSTLPMMGHMILLRAPSYEPIMALRVLKTYPEKNSFAAKYLKSYNDTQFLKVGDQFTAVEKITDVHPEIETGGEDLELQEIRQQKPRVIPAPSATLPSPPSSNLSTNDDPPPPPGITSASTPKQSPQSLPQETEDEDGEVEADSVTVPTPIQPDQRSFWVSAGIGAVLSPNPLQLTQTTYMSAFNLRVGKTLNRPLFFKRSTLTDSLVAELGTFIYKVASSASDTYTMTAFAGTLRYNIHISEHLALFAYGGFLQSLVVAYANPVPATYNAMNYFIPAIGGGLLFQIGPSWYTRLDVGYEAMTFNLMLQL